MILFWSRKINSIFLMQANISPNPNFAKKLGLFGFILSKMKILQPLLLCFLLHEIVYFGRCIPFWVADFIPFLQKYNL
ncbi:hypothetical protein C2G38_2110978 [Gigaspora rosea]|uniref:Uncharacterized protein n=1 Tax=Gigaspora rosea TaxID=44941 RepID=A0A397UMX9_9GLOM|nr:hypothetical protein C2G38_2110978 [Gigaspora rosea]